MTDQQGLLTGYNPGAFFCELTTSGADATNARIIERLATMEIAELRRRATVAEAELYSLGITFTVYSDRDAIDRILPFDLIPRVLGAAEWTTIETGVQQRVAALNLFLWDIYHDQKILRDGVVPAQLVLGNANYRPEMVGLNVPLGTYVHICGTDLVRDEHGTFLVLEDNARTPSGVSYVIENRHMMQRVFSDLMAGLNVQPVGNYGMRLHQALSEIAPTRGDAVPQVVLLSPGIYNSAYFEHIFLAREMGVPLVEGRDLVVEDGRVWMRTTAGLAPVDSIYRRLNDDFLDPAVFRPESTLGVRGLIDVWRQGRVAIANAVGTGVADDKAIYAYMPRIIKYYLDQDPILANVQTNICAEPDGLRYTLDNLARLVVKPVGESGGYGIIVGPHATQAELDEFRPKLQADPDNYISQPMVNLSVSPTLCPAGLAPRHVDLRPFAITGKSTWVLPGGLTRVALREGSIVVNSSQGGGSKDTWVLAPHSPPPPPRSHPPGCHIMSTTLPQPTRQTYLLSRYAESVFWLARYMERIENLARIMDVTVSFARQGSDSGWLSIIQINSDEKPFFARNKEVTPEAVTHFYLLDRENPNSIASAMAFAHENARTLRPLISTEMWTQINIFHRDVRQLTASDIAPSRLSQICSTLKLECQTHTGITEGTFFHDQSWAFYQLGKYLERADQTTRLVDIKYHTLLPSASDVGTAIDISQWHALLRAAAGYHAFRRVYPSGMTPATVAGFMLMNHSFPRSLVQCVEHVRMQLDQLRSGFNLHCDDASETLDELRAALTDPIRDVIARGLHEYLDWVQLMLNRIFAAIADSFWKAP